MLVRGQFSRMGVITLQMIMVGRKKDKLESPKKNQCKHQSIISSEKCNHKISPTPFLLFTIERYTKIIRTSNRFSQLFKNEEIDQSYFEVLLLLQDIWRKAPNTAHPSIYLRGGVGFFLKFFFGKYQGMTDTHSHKTRPYLSPLPLLQIVRFLSVNHPQLIPTQPISNLLFSLFYMEYLGMLRDGWD